MTTEQSKAIEELWRLVYQTFENRPGDAFRTSWATKSQSNEVQFRLTKNLADLKQTQTVDKPLLDAVRADINICATMSWITDETFDKSQTLLDELENK